MKLDTYSNESRLQEVTHRRGASLGLSVYILDTCKLEQSLRRRGSNNTRSTRCRNKTTHNGSDFSADLGRHGMGLTESSTPVSSSHRDNAQLRSNDRTSDGCSDFLGALDTKSNVAVEITNGNERLETRTLTSTGLLLDGHDLHDLVLESGQEKVDDLELFDREREEVDLLHRLDFAVLDQAA